MLRHIVEDADVGMSQDGRRTRFALEAYASPGVIELGGRKEFQGDAAMEPEVLRLVYDSHAALAESGSDLVVADGLANHGLLVSPAGTRRYAAGL
jgi:hypothetical protein